MTNRNRILLSVGTILTVIGILLWSKACSTTRAVILSNKASVALPRQPVATSRPPSDQRTTDSKNAVTAKQAFVAMGVLERNALLLEIKKKDFADILRVWLDAGRTDLDRTKQGAIATILAYEMRERVPPLDILEQMRALIASDASSDSERSQLIGILSDARTKESVELLLQAASALTDNKLHGVAMTAIRSVGASRGDGTFHEELSPVLERAWRESQNQELLISLAVAVAEVGSSDGVSMLVNSALSNEGRDEVRARAARGALEYATILNPNAVPPLAALLENQPPDSFGHKLASDTLARSGVPAAAQALLRWLRNADATMAPLFQQYVSRIYTPAVLKTWESALDPTVTFRNEKNRDAVRAGLARVR